MDRIERKKTMYKHLFSPITINGVTIKNRIAYPSLGLLYSYDSKLNQRYFDYFKEKAAGGAGIVTVGPVGVDYLGSGLMALSLASDEAIESFSQLASIIKDNGAKAWVQLFHAGAYSHPILIDGKDPIAPSAVYSPYSKTTPKEMTQEDIETVKDAFAAAAQRVKQAGFDGVEIIASAGYLLTQFLSPLTNQRDDAYGGSFENRARFPREVIERIRETVGPGFPVTIRMSGNDFVPESNSSAETPEIAKVYETASIDAINVTGGWHQSRVPQLPMELPRSAYSYLALNIKNVVSVPVMASNRISTPEIAEKIIRDGFADMVNLGRVLIADPYWPKKALEGRSDEIRPCVGCSKGCTDQIFSGLPVFCTANPRAGFEGERNIVAKENPKNVMVVGAGPAGLETAVTATKLGHQVTIYDRAMDIGGQLKIAGATPEKHELLEFISYFKAMIKKHQIPLVLNQAVDATFIREKSPDHVVIAEGAEPILPPIKGVDDPSVVNSWQVLGDNTKLGREVAVIGGGAVGLETALFAATKGTISPEVLHFLFRYDAETPEKLRELVFKGACRVTVFEMLPKAGSDVGKSTRWILLGNLKKHGVTIETSAKVTEIKAGTVTYEKDKQEVSRVFDTVIIASGSRPVTTLSDQIKALDIPFTIVGDGLKLGEINDAIHDGFLAALSI
jgi:2,4-dienoyl-CoA reductase (NADPH2)